MGNKQRKILVTFISVLFVAAVIFVGFGVKKDEGITKRPTLDSKEVINLASVRDAGTYLTDFEGRALYINEFDEVESNMLVRGCLDQCADSWKPYEASGERSFRDSSDPFLRLITVVERPDNSFQYALDDKPLYRFTGDEGVGEVRGKDRNRWNLVTIDVLTSSETGRTPPDVSQQ